MDEQNHTRSETSKTEEHHESGLQEYLDEIKKIPLLTGEQEKKLAVRIQAGDREAKEQLVAANLTLVVRIAKRYQNRGLDVVDLIQEGNLGLIRAAEKYKPEPEYRFSECASWWIRNYITKAIAAETRKEEGIGKLLGEINRMAAIQKELRQELGYEPDEKEIADRLGVSADRVLELKKIAEFSMSSGTESSGGGDESGREDSEEPPGRTEEYSFDGTPEPSNVPAKKEREQMKQFEEQLQMILESDLLTDREQKVLRFRFGLDDGCARTLEETCREFSLTRERIRQIESKALQKIRSELSKNGEDFSN